MHHFTFRTSLSRIALSIVACGFLLGMIALQISQARLARASGETVNVWLTTPDQANLLSPQSALTFGGVGSNSTTITVNDSQTYQQMVGFGASLTDSSAWLIYNKMSQSQRNQLMNELFSPTSGIGLDFLRQPMGSSDMALPAGYEGTNAPGEYTYDDVSSGQTDPNLSHFSISHDSAYIIPLLQQALQLNPNLKIMATPWTAPAWMKSNDSLQQGSLNASEFQVYAQYFVDFIKAYEAQGIPIYAVTPQNEPGNDNVMPTMPMSASDETTFIANNLGPTFAQNGISTQILGYDHNWDNPGYPTTILNNSTAASYTSGIAWHCYAGNASAMGSFHNSYPNKATYETECSGGTWEGSNWPNGFQNTMELGINSARNWAQTVVRWNLALDPNGNPNLETANSCTTCRGVVTIDQNTGNVTYNSDYYGLGHFSKFVVPGAHAVASNSFGSGNIEDAAFKNPDGSDVLVVYNGGGSSNTFQVEWNNEAFSYTLPAGAAATFTWTSNGGSTPTPTTTPGSGSYYNILNLHSGLALDDTNGATSSGTLVQQWAQTSGDANQEWSLVSDGGGYYSIINLHSGLALADPNGSTSNGTQVQLITQNNGDASQEWSLVSASGSYDYLINKASGLALDDTNGSTANGTIMQVWAQGSGNANQEWSFVATSGSTPTPTPTSTPTPTPTATSTPSGGYDYIKNVHSGLVLDDTNGATSNGTLVQQWAQTSGDANQEWSLVSAGNGSYYIVNLHSGLALDDTNGSTSNGTQVQLWTQTSGDANQEWNLVSAGGGYYYLVNVHSGLALDDTNSSTSNGTVMQLWTQTSGDTNQEWSLVQA